MWRLWTRGFGPRYWWHWMRHERIPMTLAWAIPRWLAYWVFIRVISATGENPDAMTFTQVANALEKGAGR